MLTHDEQIDLALAKRDFYLTLAARRARIAGMRRDPVFIRARRELITSWLAARALLKLAVQS
jgi:hypothetical protein